MHKTELSGSGVPLVLGSIFVLGGTVALGAMLRRHRREHLFGSRGAGSSEKATKHATTSVLDVGVDPNPSSAANGGLDQNLPDTPELLPAAEHENGGSADGTAAFLADAGASEVAAVGDGAPGQHGVVEESSEAVATAAAAAAAAAAVAATTLSGDGDVVPVGKTSGTGVTTSDGPTANSDAETPLSIVSDEHSKHVFEDLEPGAPADTLEAVLPAVESLTPRTAPGSNLAPCTPSTQHSPPVPTHSPSHEKAVCAEVDGAEVDGSVPEVPTQEIGTPLAAAADETAQPGPEDGEEEGVADGQDASSVGSAPVNVGGDAVDESTEPFAAQKDVGVVVSAAASAEPVQAPGGEPAERDVESSSAQDAAQQKAALQEAFNEALDVPISDLALGDAPPPGSPPTDAERRVERANVLAENLLNDPQKPLAAATKAQQVAVRLARAGGVRAEVLASTAMFLADMLLHGSRWGEAKQAAAVAYAAGCHANRATAKSQAMAMFGVAWNSEGRVPEAAIAYRAAISVAEGPLDVLHPSLQRARHDLSQILLKMGMQTECVRLLVSSARQLAETAQETEAATLASQVAAVAVRAAIASNDGTEGGDGEAAASLLARERMELVHNAQRAAIRSLWEAADIVVTQDDSPDAADRAENLLQEAIHMGGEAYGRRSMIFIQCLDTLSRFCRKRGRLEEALLLIRHQLLVLEEFKVFDIPMVQHRVALLRSSAQSLDELGEAQQAVDYASKALLQAQALVKGGGDAAQRAASIAALDPLYELLSAMKLKAGDAAGAREVRRTMLQARLNKKRPTHKAAAKAGERKQASRKKKAQKP